MEVIRIVGTTQRKFHPAWLYRDLKSAQAHEIALIYETQSKMEEDKALVPVRLKESKSQTSTEEDQVLSMKQEIMQLAKSKNAVESKLDARISE
ncbi:hypothetical protein NDU88_004309 [Pleurodeles waltl]|uniref:Uncharacterized protein n=1 Tax=Pleurodeles waltl TaxID=8319 RepID=A0AAV7M8X0_PLEWA|nr:hypothetical protein NDU88_004309 [Pleurodeles waltl]